MRVRGKKQGLFDKMGPLMVSGVCWKETSHTCKRKPIILSGPEKEMKIKKKLLINGDNNY